MGEYVDEARILALMPQLPATTTAAGYTQTADLLAYAIEKAESIVDGFLATKYSLPFVSIPPIVRNLACDLSIYYTARQIYSKDNISRNTFSEQYEGWEDNAFKMLQKIADGKIALTDTSGSLIEVATALQAVHGTHENIQPVFDMDDAWQIDPDLLDRIDTNRS